MRTLLSIVLLVSAGCGGAAYDADPYETGAVRIEIDMTGAAKAGWFDAATETVGLRGGVQPLTWSESLPLSDDDSDGIYEAVVVFADEASDAVPYKVFVDGLDNPNGGWERGANRSFLRSSASVVQRAYEDSTEPLSSSYTGDIRQHETFGSGTLVAARDLVVYLPPGYEDATERTYPVLYLHDGQNVFDIRGAGSEWGFDETAERLIAEGAVEPMIMVGIANTELRRQEYTPTPTLPEELIARLDSTGGPAESLGTAYARFLAEEVKPFVDATYRTRPGIEDTAVGGASLGGLISMAIGTWHPDVFGGLLVVSPSIWWDDEVIVAMTDKADLPADMKIWLDMGTDEGPGSVDAARRLRDVLVAKGWVEGENLNYVEDPGAGHNEAAWAGRAEDMLRFLYASQASPGS